MIIRVDSKKTVVYDSAEISITSWVPDYELKPDQLCKRSLTMGRAEAPAAEPVRTCVQLVYRILLSSYNRLQCFRSCFLSLSDVE